MNSPGPTPQIGIEMTKATHESRKPTFYNLSNIFFMIAIMYLILNIVVTYLLIDAAHSRTLSEKVPNYYTWVMNHTSPLIPAVYKPVDFLETEGKFNRALLVEAVYTFNWVSFIILLVSSLILVACVIGRMSEREIDFTREFILKREEHANKGYAQLIIRVFMFTAFLALTDAYWGFYDFSGNAQFTNNVTTKDQFFYRITLGLAALYLSLIIILHLSVRNSIIKSGKQK